MIDDLTRIDRYITNLEETLNDETTSSVAEQVKTHAGLLMYIVHLGARTHAMVQRYLSEPSNQEFDARGGLAFSFEEMIRLVPLPKENEATFLETERRLDLLVGHKSDRDSR